MTEDDFGRDGLLFFEDSSFVNVVDDTPTEIFSLPSKFVFLELVEGNKDGDADGGLCDGDGDDIVIFCR